MPSISSVGGTGSAQALSYAGVRAARGTQPNQLTEDQQREVEDLAKRDREVRQHEQAHLAAAGGYAKGGPSFTYTRGPDGKQYATGGEVQIDVSPGRTPQETISKAQAVQRAAAAPAEPSGQDRAVAGAAARMEQQARQELAQQQQQKAKGSASESASPAGGGGEARAAEATATASAVVQAYQAGSGATSGRPGFSATA